MSDPVTGKAPMPLSYMSFYNYHDVNDNNSLWWDFPIFLDFSAPPNTASGIWAAFDRL
jgi:hypothetical protein